MAALARQGPGGASAGEKINENGDGRPLDDTIKSGPETILSYSHTLRRNVPYFYDAVKQD
jgi:hypothetical protein